MAMGSDRAANFVIKAKDAATGPLGKVGGAMGKLKGASVTAFKAIGAAAIAAGAALVAFVANAVMAAAEDEKATIRLNAALAARGFEMDKLTPKVNEQIDAMARLGFTDDDVRNGLEIGSRFFKNQNNLLRANSVAGNIAAATGKSLSEVMMAIGRGAQGSTRGLAALGIEVERGATLKDILRAADEKYLGVAEEVANSTSGKFAYAQIRFNEALEKFGYEVLPIVTKALEFFIKEVLPKFEALMSELGPIFTNIIDEYIAPLFDSFAELFALFDNSEGSISALDLALLPLKVTLTAIKVIVDAIVFGLKAMGFGGENMTLKNLNKAAEDAGYAGGSYINPMNRTGNNNSITTNTNLYLDGQVVANSTNQYIGGYVTTTNGSRNTGRYP